MKVHCDGSRVGVRLIRAREVTCEGEQRRCIVDWYEYVWTALSVTIEREILALAPHFS
jgi:hypothetical protein